MNTRYSLSKNPGPRPSYRVIDHSLDDEVALYPDTLPNGAPHPQAGRPRSVVPSLYPAHPTPDEGRARTWGELGGFTCAVVERVPAWASVPLGTLLRHDPEAIRGIPADLLDHEGLASRPWFVSPVSWADVPAPSRPAPLTAAPPQLHPHQQPRWQDRYATAVAHGTSPRRLLEVLNRRAAR